LGLDAQLKRVLMGILDGCHGGRGRPHHHQEGGDGDDQNVPAVLDAVVHYSTHLQTKIRVVQRDLLRRNNNLVGFLLCPVTSQQWRRGLIEMHVDGRPDFVI